MRCIPPPLAPVRSAESSWARVVADSSSSWRRRTDIRPSRRPCRTCASGCLSTSNGAARRFFSSTSDLGAVDDCADLVHFLRLQIGKVPDIEPVEVDVLDIRELQMMARRYHLLEVRLPDLVSAPGAATAEFDSRVTHPAHDPNHQVVVGLPQHEIEGVVAASVEFEIGAITRWVDAGEKADEVFVAPADDGVDPLELAAPENAADFGIAHVVGGEGEDEIRVELGVLALVAPSKVSIRGLPHHAM